MRYKVDWLIDKQVLALTHFEPVVTVEDFQGIASDTQQVLTTIQRPFHMLIDNRIIKDTQVASLETMLGAMPIINHPQLRWIVMILPEPIKHEAQTMPVQEQGLIRLCYVESLESAYEHLRSADSNLNWDALDETFFNQTTIR